MSTPAIDESAEPAPDGGDARYPATRLIMGVLGRTWLWFLAGCLLITLIPILFGWRPYVVESDSMAPRIRAGDVVLSSPIEDFVATSLVGHVIVFDDPNVPGRVVTHRVASAEGEQVRTKGDANAQVDSQPIGADRVRGLGRLLVRFVGLPFIWIHRGEWLWLALFLVSLGCASWATNRDREPDVEEELTSDPPDPPSAMPEGDPPAPAGTWQVAAAKPPVIPRSVLRSTVRPLLLRLGVVFAMSLLLLLPATAAAFSATTKSPANAWAVPKYSYTAVAKDSGPYLYWKLDDSGGTAVDSSGNGRAGTYAGTYTRNVTGALTGNTPNIGVTGTSSTSATQCITTTDGPLISGPAAATVIIWFKTTTSTYAQGGKLAGFEKPQTGVAAPSTGTYDRHLYMDGSGYIWFGVYNGGYVTIRSTTALNNAAWHMAVGTVGSNGTRLYIDGALVASNATNTAAEATTGLWRAGCGNLGGWGGDNWLGGNDPTTDSGTTQNRPFLGSLDEFTVYNSQLSASDIAFLYWVH